MFARERSFADRVVVEDITLIIQGDDLVDPHRNVGQRDCVDKLRWGGVQPPYGDTVARGIGAGFIAQHGGGHGPPRVS